MAAASAMSETVASSTIPAETQPRNGPGQLTIETKDGDQTSSDGTGGSKSEQKLLKVPSRSSSQQRHQSSAASTGLSGATVTDHRNSIGGRSKDSKSSLTGRHRRGSASSRRTGRDSEQGNTLRNAKKSPGEEKKQKKRGGGLLALLGCCVAPSSGQTVEDGDTENVQKVEKLPQRPSTAKSKPVAIHDQPHPKVLNEKAPQQNETTPDNKNGNDCGNNGGSDGSGSGENQASSRNHPDDEFKPAVPPAPPAVTIDPPKSECPDNGSQYSDKSEGNDSGMKDEPPTDDVGVIPAAPQSDEPSEKPVLQAPPTPDSPAPALSPASPADEVAVEEAQKWLLPPVAPAHVGRKCLVLDLDETLVHSSFKILNQADFTIPVEIEGTYHNVYVIKRPGVDEFMKRVGELYEVVVFTASVSKYGDPLLDQLDINKVVHHRLFRESCYNHQGNYVKDLSQVGRDLKNTIIIDNSPTSYIFHPQHAVPISSWFSDAHDNELLDLIPVLEDLAGPNVADVSLSSPRPASPANSPAADSGVSSGRTSSPAPPGGARTVIRRRAAADQKEKIANARPTSTRAAGAGGSSSTMLRLYTDESPGLKVDPVIVLVLSLVFIFSVVALHNHATIFQLGRTWESRTGA
ncbi:hypothetical protein CP532_6472 [Ophiocordyceps camponoti-leonardi (nom. inval.)]|nr:hypothetical protein CP532_6472 [Ophiocordyceps camponoti-leonardi (nom. inval.)]